MIDSTDHIFSTPIKLNFDGKDADATLALTEGGTISVELHNQIPYSTEPNSTFEKIEGSTPSGDEVILSYVVVTTSHQPGDSINPHTISSVNYVNEAVIDGIGGTPFINEQVEIQFDVFNLSAHYPHFDNATNINIPLVQRPDWEATGRHLAPFEERLEFIKSKRRPIRTLELTVKQEDQNGPPRVQLERSFERLANLLELSSFALGVGSAPIQATITQTNDDGSESIYKKIYNNSCDIGGAYSHVLTWGDLPEFIDEAYDWYADSGREDYKLNSVIGFYLDSINPTRSVHGQLSTMFNGIELLAKRHADMGPDYRSTQRRIQYMVHELGVDVSDLARHSMVFPDDKIPGNGSEEESWEIKLIEWCLPKLRSFRAGNFVADKLEARTIDLDPQYEYFYSKTRQHIVHGDNHSTFEGKSGKLATESHATIVMFQRLIRNRLVGKNNVPKLVKMSGLEPREFTKF